MTDNVKTAEELLKIMKASAMGDACFSHLLGWMTPDMSEKEIAEEVRSTFEKLGSSELAFPTICVAGENGADPHGEPSDRRIRKGDLVTIDMGAVVGGLCGDMTRTVGIGEISPEQKKIYDTVLAAQEEALAVCRAGVRCFDVDKAARDVIEKAGYGEFYIHGTGHGVGTEVHEEPYLNARAPKDEILQENMAVTVEPGIYLPGRFGVRIEDLAIVTGFGIINTVKSTKELILI